MRFIYCLLFQLFLNAAMGQSSTIAFSSTDTSLQNAFREARKMALSYRGNPADPVGPWYEAALPSRNAFCMRDVSHQCIAAEILSMPEENKNMFTHFVSNISDSKDWCSYWEMNIKGLPAPEDYRNDTAFWYNLNGNFDLVYASWRLFLWTGDSTYIFNPAFEKFRNISSSEFIERWILQADSLVNRPPYPNTPLHFNLEDYFHRCRGLPSYSEGVEDLRIGVDLIAALYQGMLTCSSIEIMKGNNKAAAQYSEKAEAYRKHLDKYWWDPSAGLYNTHITNNGVYGKGEGETYLLWFNALTDTARIRQTLNHLAGNKWNVENLSYHPAILYKYGYWEKAYEDILYLANPATPRRDYPEVSYGVIDGIVQGLMGVEADARYNTIKTIYRSSNGHSATLQQLPVLQTRVTIIHEAVKSSFKNEGNKNIVWRAAFNGRHKFIYVGGRKSRAKQQQEKMGNIVSYIDLMVAPQQQVTAALK
ncbi:trehalase family glycosidase [Flavihumibacter profundi]|jgi:hypothetical protein|uniref:trehalase family glycosidase n=1 Tax=Flavihumibacter profundi TaxID=2716883 RepID=UPI001CC59F55|nr:trehalase family glycosidase [Flavihumibacter profundi]MBZ5855522.1 hypothetical protein [Flavihumibacter profundi]